MPPKRKRSPIKNDRHSPGPKKRCALKTDENNAICEPKNKGEMDVTKYHLVNRYSFATKEDKEAAIKLERAWGNGLEDSLRDFMEPYEESDGAKPGAWVDLISSLIKGAIKPANKNPPLEITITLPPARAEIPHQPSESTKKLWEFFEQKFKDDLELFREEITTYRPDIPPDYSSDDFVKTISELLHRK